MLNITLGGVWGVRPVSLVPPPLPLFSPHVMIIPTRFLESQPLKQTDVFAGSVCNEHVEIFQRYLAIHSPYKGPSRAVTYNTSPLLILQ